LDGGSLTAREKSWTRRARALDRLGDAIGQSHGPARVRFEHQPQRTTLSVERGQELDPTVGRGQHAVHEALQRRIVIVGGICHARFDVPAGAVLIAQPCTRGARSVLDARHT
jgi:hypothetical protein